MIKYFYYGNAGGISKVKEREVNNNNGYASSIKEILQTIINTSTVYKDYDVKHFKIIYYGYDYRIKKDVYMIVANYKKYKNQYVRYFIEEETKCKIE